MNVHGNEQQLKTGDDPRQEGEHEERNLTVATSYVGKTVFLPFPRPALPE